METSMVRYRALLGLEADITMPYADPSSGVVTAQIMLPRTILTLQAPLTTPRVAALPPLTQALENRLATRGEGPYSLTIARGTSLLPIQLARFNF